ncbi:hypothetical protein F5148DRAFT_1223916 [Russula earlei]|uniref:Uncharacterized protein n=1 Tax=Russula earlei TaxID=71964 RepID=A0ACC0U0P0_9AGAM|nr:hypothetical protein F5148DRAFT_1223916 [Russula earlei]
MHTSSVFVIFCLTVGIAPSFALPLEVRSPNVLHTRGASHSSQKQMGKTPEPHPSKLPAKRLDYVSQPNFYNTPVPKGPVPKKRKGGHFLIDEYFEPNLDYH